MNAQNNAARVAAQAELCQKPEEQPVDVHAAYQSQAACGYDRTLSLVPGQVQGIASRLRGISAISALLIAAEGDQLKLSSWMRGGLQEALHDLAEDAHYVLERQNEFAQEGR